MTVRVAQVSDTHLAARAPGFRANFDRLAAAVRAARPDLVVHTGDLSLDGADTAADLALGRAAMDALGLEWLAVPGNHDVGDDPLPGCRQPVTGARLARWHAEVGPDRFTHDVPGWRLIGLDSQITSAGLPATDAGWEALAAALDGAAGRSVALFSHKPLYEEGAAETAATYWCVQPAARARLLGLLERAPPRLVASGHVHQWRDRGVVDGMRQVWAPSAAFLVGDPWQVRVGEKLLGYVEHLFHADGAFESRLVRVPGLLEHDIGELPEFYGALPRVAGGTPPLAPPPPPP